jgi:uncharacterized membrane protein
MLKKEANTLFDMRKAIFLFMMLILVTPVLSHEDYADLNLRVDEKGFVYFSGSTNYEPFVGQSEYFTSKKGPYWLINITTKEVFSDYYISLEFPKNTEINYIKTQGSFRIAETPTLKLITTGKDEPVEIIVQYTILNNTGNINLLLLIGGVILLGLLMFFAIMKPLSKEPEKQQNQTSSKKLEILKHTLTENQKLILEILQQAKEPITQKQLQHRTNLPKATLSRNLELLKQKGIITKQSRGMVNVIFLNETLRN